MKSKKVFFIIIPICLALVAAIVLVVLFATGAFLSPKARVMLALSRTFGSGSIISEYSGNTNVSEYGYAPEYLADLLKISDTFTSMQERGYSFDSSFTITDLETEDAFSFDTLSGTGMKLSGDVDTINRIAYYKLTSQYSFVRVSLEEYYINDNSISMAMPKYFDGYLTLPTDTFGSSYNASIFPSAMGLGKIPQELESQISFSAYDLLCYSSSEEDSFWADEDNLSALMDFYDAIEVEKTGETRSILVGAKQQDCSEYKITFDEDAVLSLIESYEDWYFSSNEETLEKYEAYYAYFATLDDSGIDPSSTLSDIIESIFDGYKDLLAVDHEIYVYLDNKDRLAAASYENELDTSSLSSLLNGDFTDTAEELINEYYDPYDDFDDLIGDLYFGYLDGSYPNVDDFNDSTTDSTDASDLPESCRISAEIIFHGRDYLPERYEGSLLFALDNGYSCDISYTGENKTETDNLLHSVLYAALDLSDNDTTNHLDLVYNVSYQAQDHNLTAEITATDENNLDILDITLDSTAEVNNDTIELELEELVLTTRSEAGKNGISITAEASISPLSDRVPIPEGRERNLFTMSDGDYELLFEEIIDNFW